MSVPRPYQEHRRRGSVKAEAELGIPVHFYSRPTAGDLEAGRTGCAWPGHTAVRLLVARRCALPDDHPIHLRPPAGEAASSDSSSAA